MLDIKNVEIAKITVSEGRRQLRSIDQLAQSISDIGLLNPVVITADFKLVAGYHRLEACKSLGWDTIPASIINASEVENLTALSSDPDMEDATSIRLGLELMEIDENLVRNDLTTLERSEQLARRKEIYEELHPETKAKVAGAIASNKKQGKGNIDTSEIISFASDTSLKTGSSKRTIEQEVQIATSLTPETKELLRNTEVADKKTDLLRMARMEPEQQERVAEKIASGEAKSVTDATRLVRKETLPETPELTGKYRVIYADPPWEYGNSGLDQYGPAARHYPTMSIKELCALPIAEYVEDDAVLFMWVTSPMLEVCFEVIKAWSFKYKTSFVWDKVKHNMGHYNSVRHEFLLVCTRGSCTPDINKLHDSVIEIERSGEHSEKPEYFRQLIDHLYPHGKRVELFARSASEGWDVFGNECSSAA